MTYLMRFMARPMMLYIHKISKRICRCEVTPHSREFRRTLTKWTGFYSGIQMGLIKDKIHVASVTGWSNGEARNTHNSLTRLCKVISIC